MLVLTRKIGEVICIGDDIDVVILGIYHKKAKIGINAPKNVEVHRQEIKDRIDQGRTMEDLNV